MTNETMGRRLQRLRMAADLTQAALAERAGVPLRSLRNWEQDHREPRLDAALSLARVLGVLVEELMAGLAPRDERPPVPRGRPPAGGPAVESAKQKAGKVERRR